MPRFEFRLQGLLELRLVERDTARQRWLEAQRALDALNDQSRHLAHQRDRIRDLRRARSIGMTRPEQLLADDRYEVQLAYEQIDIGEKQRQVQQELERRHQRLIEADQQVRMLERLREKRHKEFSMAESKLAQVRADDSASVRHFRHRIPRPMRQDAQS
jgi:flagellar export protein FliJ